VAFCALTADVISLYSYGTSYDYLAKPDFEAGMGKLIVSGGELSLLLRQYPWIFKIANLLPYSLVARLDDKLNDMINRRKVTQFHFVRFFLASPECFVSPQ
jgi:hypothetical protein